MPHRIYELVHWPLVGGLLLFVQRGGTRRGRSPHRPLLPIPNTAHPSTASIPITVLSITLQFKKMPIKGLKECKTNQLSLVLLHM